MKILAFLVAFSAAIQVFAATQPETDISSGVQAITETGQNDNNLKVQKKALPDPQKVSLEYIRQQVLSKGRYKPEMPAQTE